MIIANIIYGLGLVGVVGIMIYFNRELKNINEQNELLRVNNDEMIRQVEEILNKAIK